MKEGDIAQLEKLLPLADKYGLAYIEVGLLALAAGVLVELQPARLAPIIVVRRSVLSPLVLFIGFNVNASLIFLCILLHGTASYELFHAVDA